MVLAYVAVAVLVLAILGAVAFGRWLQRKGTDIEKGGREDPR